MVWLGKDENGCNRDSGNYRSKQNKRKNQWHLKTLNSAFYDPIHDIWVCVHIQNEKT